MKPRYLPAVLTKVRYVNGRKVNPGTRIFVNKTDHRGTWGIVSCTVGGPGHFFVGRYEYQLEASHGRVDS